MDVVNIYGVRVVGLAKMIWMDQTNLVRLDGVLGLGYHTSIFRETTRIVWRCVLGKLEKKKIHRGKMLQATCIVVTDKNPERPQS